MPFSCDIVDLLNISSDNMEEYLISVNNTVEFTEILEKITDDCALEFGGGKVHKYIHILVNICE